MTNLRLFIFLVFATFAYAKTLPPYITRCSRSDEKLEECAIESANKALPSLLKGDKSINIPNLLPLKIPKIMLSPGNNLQINLTDADLFGLNNSIIRDIDFDFEKQHCEIKVDIHHLNLLGTYDVNGNILILPISGHGPANITFVGGNYTFDFSYKLISRDGTEYIEFTEHNLEYKTTRIFLRLDNLFNGDVTLGTEMNKFLDESWKEVSDELYPSLKGTISAIISTIASGLFTKIPYNSIFLP